MYHIMQVCVDFGIDSVQYSSGQSFICRAHQRVLRCRGFFSEENWCICHIIKQMNLLFYFLSLGDYYGCTSTSPSCIYILQLVYKPHFGTWIHLFGPFGQLLRVVFSTFCGEKKNWKDCSVLTKKLHKIKFIFIF